MATLGEQLDAQLAAFSTAVGTDIGTIINDLGDKALLNTATKDNLVAAINELKGVSDAYGIDISDIEDDIVTLFEDVGDVAQLTTSDKGSLVLAINELVTRLNGVDSDITDIDNDILAIYQDLGSLEALSTTDKTSLVNAINEVSSNLTLAQVGVMKWKGFWGENILYPKDSVVSENNYLGIVTATNGTSDHLQPQPIGEAAYVYDGTISTQQNTVKQVIFGTRYRITSAQSVKTYRIYTIAGNFYQPYLVLDSTGTPVIQEFPSFEAPSTGWQEFNTLETIIPINSEFDVVVLVREPDPTPTVSSHSYDYTTPNNFTVPSVGEITHATKDIPSLHINKTAQSSDDATATLTALTIGDIIEVGSRRWAIQNIIDNVTYMTFQVSPESLAFSTGIQTFNFETVTATPITTAIDTNYYSADLDTDGLFIADGRWSSIVPNNNAYGVDLKLQPVTVSSDWNIMTYPSGTGGVASGGGEGASTIVQLTDTPGVITDRKILVGESGVYVEKTFTEEGVAQALDITWAQLVALVDRKNGDRFILTDSAYAGNITLDSEEYFTWVDPTSQIYYKIEIV